MTRTLVLLSHDAVLIDRLTLALAPACTVMALDPRDDANAAIQRLAPQAIALDAGHAGAASVLERIAQARAGFPGLPLVIVGDETSAQLILAAFRAGADDFIDRDASDAEIREGVMARLRGPSPSGATEQAALVSILSPAPSDEDADLALNAASAIAQAQTGHRVLLIDLSLPVSPAKTALGLDFHFTVNDAIRDANRLDRTFLESALARVPASGLQVLPLAGDDGELALPAMRDLARLVALLRALFDTVVVGWDAFSPAAARAGIAGEHALVCCNQRFSSVRAAKNFLALMADAEPVLAIHQMDAHLVPDAAAIAQATGAAQTLTLRAPWGALAAAHNRGVPLALDGPSAYGDALRTHLAAHGLLPGGLRENPTLKLLHWLRR